MIWPSREPKKERSPAAAIADLFAGKGDLRQRQQLRSGQQRGRRAVKTASLRRQPRRSPAQRGTSYRRL